VEEPGDEDLMRLYLRGDIAAFDQLYTRHRAKVYGYVRKRVYVAAEADEVFQAIWLKFHASRSRYLPRYLVLQWLFVIGRSVVYDHLRASNKGLLDAAAFAEQSAPASKEGLPAELLASLDERSRKVLEERFVDDRSYDEIAERLSLSSAGVRQIASRALRKLRARGNAT